LSVLLLVILLAALPGAGAASPSAQTPSAARYRIMGAATRQQRSAIVAVGVAIDGVGPGWVDVSATPEDLRRIAALGFVAQPLPTDFPPLDAAYHNYAEMVAEVQAVAAAHPEIVQLFSIGRSYEGRELWAAKISDNVAIDEDEPEALFVGHYHAREHLTVEMLLYLLNELTGTYGSDPQVTTLVDIREIFLIFDLNPDGGEFDVGGGYYHSWRKNLQPNIDGSFGTDLNRNHSYRWGGPGASNIPTSEMYRGLAPASAPEVAAIEAFVNSRAIGGVQQISVAISFHTPGNLVLWPYSYTDEDLPGDMFPDDYAVLLAMGQTMAATNGYTPQQFSDMYIASGEFTDWAYGTHHIFAYTFEMSNGYLSGPLILEQTARNRAAVLYLLLQAGCPYEVIGAAATHCTDGRINDPWLTWLPIVGR
jgi:carboxypeptidase T